MSDDKTVKMEPLAILSFDPRTGQYSRREIEKKPFELSEDELKICSTTPDVLVAIADYHDLQATMAAPMGMNDSAAWHERRAEELRTEARRISDKWEE